MKLDFEIDFAKEFKERNDVNSASLALEQQQQIFAGRRVGGEAE